MMFLVNWTNCTEADKKNDFRSLERALDSHLLLVVEQKIGKQWKWICPHGKWENGETLRQVQFGKLSLDYLWLTHITYMLYSNVLIF